MMEAGPKQQSHPEQRVDEVWAGTRAAINLATEPNAKLEVELWLETSTGILRMADIVPASKDLTSFSHSFWKAVSAPLDQREAFKPGRILVDRQELSRALQPLATMQGIEVDVNPNVARLFETVVARMEDNMANHQGFEFLKHGDLDPSMVAAYYEQAYAYLQLEPWHLLGETDWIAIEGLAPGPLYCTMIGESDDPGLLMCYSLEGAREFATTVVGPEHNIPSLSLMLYLEHEIGPELQAELDQHQWRRHPLGAAFLVRGDRPDRHHPTPDELQLMTRVLEAFLRYVEAFTESARKFKLQTGEAVKVRFADELIGTGVGINDSKKICQSLDDLAKQDRFADAITLASQTLSLTPIVDANVLWRLAAYTFQLHDHDHLDELWVSSAADCPSDWYYIGALNAMALGNIQAFKQRLWEGLHQSPELAKRLAGRASKKDDDFLRIWRPLWKSYPEAMQLLKEMSSK